MPPLERIAHVLAESGHPRTDVTYFVEQFRAIMALRTLPHLREYELTVPERQRAYAMLLEGRSVHEAIVKPLRVG
jgi:hypothetical protein